MALSMDEQRMLAEIERRLAADDPGLATCLTSFRRPGPATVLRSPRARIIGSLFTVLLVAMVSLMVYAMIPFRAHGARTPAPSTGTQGKVAISATGTGAAIGPAIVSSPSASASAKASPAPRAPSQSAAPSADASASVSNARGTGSQAEGQTAPGP
jgi:hypothetical protein